MELFVALLVMALIGTVGHMGLLSVLNSTAGFAGAGDAGGKKAAAGDGDGDGDGDAGGDTTSAEEEFLSDMFPGKDTKKTVLKTDGDADDGDDDGGKFGNKTKVQDVDYGDPQADESDQDGNEGDQGSTEKRKKANDQGDEKKKPGEKGGSGKKSIEDVDLETVDDDSLLSMIGDASYTSRERGFLKQVHKDRRKRQEAQAERDHALLLLKTKPAAGDDDDIDDDDDDDADVLTGKADDDMVSVADIKKLIAKQHKQEQKAAEKEQKAANARQRQTQAQQEQYNKQMQQFQETENVMKAAHDDYEDMMKVAATAMKEYPGLAHQMNTIAAQGGDPVAWCYKLGQKYSPIYLEAIKKGSAGTAADQDADPDNDSSRMLKNASKRKTSATLGGSSTSKETTFDLDALEAMNVDTLVRTLVKMSPKQLLKVPKRIRDRALGS